MQTSHSARLSPRALYHAFWNEVWSRFYERSRLEGWARWEHRFDHRIHTERDAYFAIREMLASLDDRYTELKTPSVVLADEAALERAPSPVFWTMWNGGVGYIRVDTWNHKDVASCLRYALECLEDASSFILDLRGNPGGYLAEANLATTLFIERGPAMRREWWENGWSRRETWQIAADGLVFELTHSQSGDLLDSGINERLPYLLAGRPVFLLVDSRTMSAAELFAGILRENSVAVIIGSESAGKGIGQTTLPVANGCELKITSGVFLPPSCKWFGDDGQTWRNGLRPDIEVYADRRYHGDLVADIAWCRLVGAPEPHVARRRRVA